MLANYHTHTTYCDGKNTPEEVVLYAIDKGFTSLGFSGHGYTPFILNCCMKDTAGYIREISRLKRKYSGKIQIYCGVEEDAFSFVNRDDFDYIIGSSHYFYKEGTYYSIDSRYDCFQRCLTLFEDDTLTLAEAYYQSFTDYIIKRKPDIIGHFDLITKFDEMDETRFLNDSAYLKIAEKYIKKATECDALFEVNTGAISRGYRKSPYPQENLLYILKEKGSKLILSSDSHRVETLSFYFEETKQILRDVGFKYVYELDKGEFKKRFL